MSEDVVKKTVLDSYGPSTRRIKLREEWFAEQAIRNLANHEEGSRDWARRENTPLHVPVVKD